MHITYCSIFPEIFESFINTTIIKRAVTRGLLSFETINPRHFCDDKHRTIDDEIYGGGHGLLMKAQPIIDSIKHRIKKHNLKKSKDDRQIIIPHPSKKEFNQHFSHAYSHKKHILFICGRYEGIDHRLSLWLNKKYTKHIQKISLGKFITLGGELPAMTMTESIVRLLPEVINSVESRQEESYSPSSQLQNIEHPQYTRPYEVEKMKVPDILLSGNHKKIQERKHTHSTQINNNS